MLRSGLRRLHGLSICRWTATPAASATGFDDADIITEAEASQEGGNMLIWAYYDPIPGYAYYVMMWACVIVGFIKGWLEDRQDR
jgi:hypothetical protein